MCNSVLDIMMHRGWIIFFFFWLSWKSRPKRGWKEAPKINQKISCYFREWNWTPRHTRRYNPNHVHLRNIRIWLVPSFDI